jgi:hypothetical protein
MEERMYDPESVQEAKPLHARIRNGCIQGLLGIDWGNILPNTGCFFEFIRIKAGITCFDAGLIGELPR